eukprot:768298-Hanusia_phi.AAC.1
MSMKMFVLILPELLLMICRRRTRYCAGWKKEFHVNGTRGVKNKVGVLLCCADVTNETVEAWYFKIDANGSLNIERGDSREKNHVQNFIGYTQKEFVRTVVSLNGTLSALPEVRRGFFSSTSECFDHAQDKYTSAPENYLLGKSSTPYHSVELRVKTTVEEPEELTQNTETYIDNDFDAMWEDSDNEDDSEDNDLEVPLTQRNLSDNQNQINIQVSTPSSTEQVKTPEYRSPNLFNELVYLVRSTRHRSYAAYVPPVEEQEEHDELDDIASNLQNLSVNQSQAKGTKPDRPKKRRCNRPRFTRKKSTKKGVNCKPLF